MSEHHTVDRVQITGSSLTLSIDGQEHSFPFERISSALAGATREQLSNFEISPSGYGIHWPLLDEDLSIDGLLGISHATKPQNRQQTS